MLATFLLFAQFACEDDHFDPLPSADGLTEAKVISAGSKRHRCNTDKCMHGYYRNHPGHQDAIFQGRRNVHDQVKTSRSVDDEVLVVPVHVIVVHPSRDGIGEGANVSMARINSQIEALNLDFRLQNSNAGFTPAQFSKADSRIRFCLASTAPDGSGTNGVTRYAYDKNFDRNEEQVKQATGWDPLRYMNVWVSETIDGLGYAYLPSVSERPDPAVDGIAILTSAFGGPNSGADAPFDLGKTVTHEVGHYLGLDHIWGDGCGIDDGIDDTPGQKEENYDCPAHPSPSCGNQGDMFMNYMDYSNDECLSAFTEGQAVYMRAVLRGARASLLEPGLTGCQPGDEVDPEEEEEEEEEVEEEEEPEEEEEEPTDPDCLTLQIQPDEYASDIVWLVKDGDGNVLYKGNDYEDGDIDLIEQELCLSEGCYRLIFRDRWGDGLCCDYGEGWYSLTTANGEELVFSDGYFGSKEVTWFCVGDQGYRLPERERDQRISRPRDHGEADEVEQGQ